MFKSCESCQESCNAPPKTVLHPWEYPKSPWSRLHVDYAGPLFGRMYLIVLDAFSKWVEIAVTHTATSEAAIEGLRHMFYHTWYQTMVLASQVSNLQISAIETA